MKPLEPSAGLPTSQVLLFLGYFGYLLLSDIEEFSDFILVILTDGKKSWLEEGGAVSISMLSPMIHVLSMSMSRGSKNSVSLRILGLMVFPLIMALICLDLVETGVQT